MTRKKGSEEAAAQEGAHNLRGPKEKVAQGAAAKLERFAHTPNCTPKKGNQGGAQLQGAQINHPGGRKSQGPAEICIPSVTESALQTCLVKESGLSGLGHEVIKDKEAAEQEPSLKDILLAINVCKTTLSDLSDQLRGIRDDLVILKKDMQEVCARTTALEERLSQVEDDVNPLRQEVKKMKAQLDTCLQKIDEYEYRARRKNVRVLGLPEKSEGNNPVEFMEGWFRGMFGKDAFSKMFAIERAHRIAPRVPHPGGQPRPLIVKILFFRDKVTILQKAREMKNILYNGARISLYPDFSPELQRQRAKFVECKRSLQRHGLRYALLYPARLRVIANGEVKFFNDPAEVSSWLEKYEGRLRPGEGIRGEGGRE